MSYAASIARNHQNSKAPAQFVEHRPRIVSLQVVGYSRKWTMIETECVPENHDFLPLGATAHNRQGGVYPEDEFTDTVFSP
jgi:hypothetical protein